MSDDLRWTHIDGQWHAHPRQGTRYMAVSAVNSWYACTVAGTKHKRGQTLSPTGETEEEAKARCEEHWNSQKHTP